MKTAFAQIAKIIEYKGMEVKYKQKKDLQLNTDVANAKKTLTQIA